MDSRHTTLSFKNGLSISMVIGILTILAFIYIQTPIGKDFRNDSMRSLWLDCREIREDETACKANRKCYWDTDFQHVDCGFGEDYCGPVCVPKKFYRILYLTQ